MSYDRFFQNLIRRKVKKMRGTGLKYQDLAEAFADDFAGNKNFTSDELSKWASEHGYPAQSEVRTDHARRIVRYLRMSGDHPRMGDKAFRIITRGWREWEKQLLTTDVLQQQQHETCQKMRNAANNGQRRNAKSASVLLDRQLSPREQYVVTISPKVYELLLGTMQTIETLLTSLTVTIEDHQSNLLNS
jgi:hypothetical protein